MARQTNREMLEEIKREIKGVKSMQNVQATDITELKTWRKNMEIAKQAVAEYKQTEQAAKDAKQRREIMKQIGYVLGLIGLVLYIYLQSHGVHL